MERTIPIAPAGSIHIDWPYPRMRLCDGLAGDVIYHPTPAIAEALLTQHPSKATEFCPRCLIVLRQHALSAGAPS